MGARGCVDSCVHKLLLVGRVPGCANTCGAISLSDVLILAICYRLSIVLYGPYVKLFCVEYSLKKEATMPAVVYIGNSLGEVRS